MFLSVLCELLCNAVLIYRTTPQKVAKNRWPPQHLTHRYGPYNMALYMKTTVDIADPLFRQLRQWATQHGMTMREVLETALRRFLGERGTAARRFRLRRHPFKGKGLVPDLAPGDWAPIRRRIYEGRGG